MNDRVRITYTDSRGASVMRLLPAAYMAAYLPRARMDVEVRTLDGQLVGRSWRLSAQERADCGGARRWGYWYELPEGSES